MLHCACRSCSFGMQNASGQASIPRRQNSIRVDEHWLDSQLEQAVPTIGYSGWFMSWFSVIRLFTNGRRVLQNGYDLNPVGIFRVPGFDRWEHFVAGEKLVDDLRRAGDHELSFQEEISEVSCFCFRISQSYRANIPCVNDVLPIEFSLEQRQRMRFDYTVKSNLEHSQYHLKFFKTKMTSFGPYWWVFLTNLRYWLNDKFLGWISEDLHDECVIAMQDLVQTTERGMSLQLAK